MKNTWSDFVSFRAMITPVIIRALFWIGVILCLIVGLVGVISGASSKYGGVPQAAMGLGIMLVGPVLVRVYCEILILFFRINETLTEMNNKLPPALSSSAPSIP